MEEENKLRTDGRNVKEGDKPFDFEFQDIQGKTSKLSDLIGEKKNYSILLPEGFYTRMYN